MILIALALATASSKCSPDGSQIELDVCADQHARAADEALNRAWGAAIARARRQDQGGLSSQDESKGLTLSGAMLKAQRTWLLFRDQTCLSEGLAYSGGSIRPMIEGECRARLAEARTKDLQTMFLQN